MNKILKKIVCCILVVGISINLAVPCFAATDEEKTIRIGYIDYEEFIGKNKKGDFSGYGVESLHKISQITGWKYEYVYDTWKNHMKNLKDGKIDFLCHAQKTPERERDYLFSRSSIGTETNLLYARSDDKRFFYNDFKNFDGKTVGLLKNSFQNDQFFEIAKLKNFKCNSKYYDDSTQTFKALDNGEVDLVAMGSIPVIKGYKVVGRISADPFYFITGKKNGKLMEKLDDAMLEILTADPYFAQKLYNKYYATTDNTTSLNLTRDEIEFLKKVGPITVGIFPKLFPYSDCNENGKPIGIEVDILNLISEKSGLEFKYEMLGINETAISYLKDNPNNFISGVYTQNEDFFAPTNIISNEMVGGNLVLLCRKGEEYYSNRDKQYTIAIPKTEVYIQNITEKLYPKDKIKKYDTIEDCIEAVKDREADFVMQNNEVIINLLQNPRNEKLTIAATKMQEETRSIAANASYKNRKIMNIIDKGLATIPKEEITKITLEQSSKTTFNPSFIDYLYKYRYGIVISFVFIGCIILFVAFKHRIKNRYLKILKAKNKQLNNANEAKSQFLSRVSHDMRTPMNGILGIAYLAKEKDDIDELKFDMQQISLSGKMLLDLINDTLDISRIENGKMELHPTICDEQIIINTVLASVRPLIDEKNISFSYKKINVRQRKFYADAQRLQQIVTNILTNAVKFTPVGGNVLIVLECLEERKTSILYQLTITDTGIGMSEEFQKNLFTSFSQENKINTDSRVGTGLGLTIVKNIVDLMGGTIAVKSEENVGTQVTITMEIPLSQKSQEVEVNKVMLPESLKGKRVLLCEDHDLNANIIIHLLEKVGVIVDRAENGLVGLKKLEGSDDGYYNVVLMDIRMPVMDGYEATEKIRKLQRDYEKNIPIIAISANALVDDIKKSIEIGMNDHLSKPIVPQKLYEVLERYLNMEMEGQE